MPTRACSLRQFSLPTGLPGTPLRFDNNSSFRFLLPAPPVRPSSSPTSTSPSTRSPFPCSSRSPSITSSSSNSLPPTAPPISSPPTTVFLGANYGLACSPESQRTTFDDDAATPIASGAAALCRLLQTQQTALRVHWQVRHQHQRPLAASRHRRGPVRHRRHPLLVAVPHPDPLRGRRRPVPRRRFGGGHDRAP